MHYFIVELAEVLQGQVVALVVGLIMYKLVQTQDGKSL